MKKNIESLLNRKKFRSINEKAKPFERFFYKMNLNPNSKVMNEKDSSLPINNNDLGRISKEFFMTDSVTLAERLLGKILVKKIDGVECKVRIVETEAYKAPEDKACHAYNNRKTERTKYLWQRGGHLYVYMIHNVNCMNITSATENDPQGVLIRAVEPIEGVEKIREMRSKTSKGKVKEINLRDLTNGPGKVGGALSVDRNHNGIDLCSHEHMFLIEDANYKCEIERSVRINIDYAGEWKYKPWRFYIKGNQYVSRVRIPYEYKVDL